MTKQIDTTVNKYDIPYNRLVAAGTRETSQCETCKSEFVSSLQDEDFKIILLNAALKDNKLV